MVDQPSGQAYSGDMGSVNVYDAKTHFSHLLRRVRGGEEIVIAAAGRPIARLVPITPDAGPRVLGGDEGRIWEADDFNAPLPDTVVDPFYGSRAVRAQPRSRARSQGRARTKPAKRKVRHA
jgi:prevent-host-death family protein